MWMEVEVRIMISVILGAALGAEVQGRGGGGEY